MLTWNRNQGQVRRSVDLNILYSLLSNISNFFSNNSNWIISKCSRPATTCHIEGKSFWKFHKENIYILDCLHMYIRHMINICLVCKSAYVCPSHNWLVALRVPKRILFDVVVAKGGETALCRVGVGYVWGSVCAWVVHDGVAATIWPS